MDHGPCDPSPGMDHRSITLQLKNCDKGNITDESHGPVKQVNESARETKKGVTDILTIEDEKEEQPITKPLLEKLGKIRRIETIRIYLDRTREADYISEYAS